ncbi:hypothetical protein [Vibrio campbellii]|uniref:hypothetical protein n=1 Tax=Vibrio campbellii TaxID=680 RepID=UPI0037368AF6
MKKTIATLAVMGALSSASAMAAGATANFQWAGAIPAQEVSNGIEIRQVGSTAFTDGILEFSNTPAGIILKDASVITFDVVKAADKSVVKNYTFSLGNVVVSNGGISKDHDTTYFGVSFNGLPHYPGWNTPVTDGLPVDVSIMDLTMGEPAPASLGLEAGQNVMVQASIYVNATI